MNGGAWLTIDDNPLDVLHRDLDTVERWLDDAQQSGFEVLAPERLSQSCSGA
jgi:hypothetical protein